MAKKSKAEKLLEAAFDDPEPSDEDDPEVKNETFIGLKRMGVTPEELPDNDPKFKAEYTAFLKKSG